MKIFETAETLHLPDERVWVAGDWHGNAGWVRSVFRAMRRFDDRVETVLQLGDFWPTEEFLSVLDGEAKLAGFKRVLFLPGNHEPWPLLIQIEEDLAPGQAARISEVVWFLPRPFRFTVAGRRVLALGGAASVDKHWRTPGRDWWEEELITEQHEQAAVAGGPADVMLTHESPVSAVPEAQRILDDPPLAFRGEVQQTSAAQRERVERVWEGVQPKVLLHGHMHVFGDRELDDGRKVISLACDGMAGNVGVLDMATLELAPMPLTAF